ncbi:hypothetical protein ROA7450_03153 [Roseovarius albus]|uniref:Uncharacterized protein n=1 Tax=Roseovarius albus TaxID=1247867 RepID=A0A1X6ZTL3_9RHOB|nr:hypothetical protein [Roseovarius albus]SLN61129.1 hypothetical protein ROA7450_03153 [Roseovarius albus]
MHPNRLSVFIASMMLMPVAGVAEDDSHFLITGERLACVMSHSADYSFDSGDVAFIAVEDCSGDGGGQVSLANMVLNSAPDVSVADDQAPDAVVALSKDDLACLANLDVAGADALYAFYPNGCRLEQKD